MENVNYANMANDLLGNEIAKENKEENIVDFGKEVINKCCFLIVALGMSRKINLDNIKICIGGKAVKVPCKEFAIKYERYVKEIENTIDNTI